MAEPLNGSLYHAKWHCTVSTFKELTRLVKSRALRTAFVEWSFTLGIPRECQDASAMLNQQLHSFNVVTRCRTMQRCPITTNTHIHTQPLQQQSSTLTRVSLHCFDTLGWLGVRKSIRPVKTTPASQWWCAGVVICLQQGANDLHMAQLMPLPPHHLLFHQNPEWFKLFGVGLPRMSCKEGR